LGHAPELGHEALYLLAEWIRSSSTGAGDACIDGLFQLEVNQQVQFANGEIGFLLTQGKEVPQYGVPLKRFLGCLIEMELLT
jgi:hypothetical protein